MRLVATHADRQVSAENLPKACVILGAGASHDVRNEGSLVGNEDLQPPLATDLFNIARHPVYSSYVLNKYPGAHFLAQLLGPVISSGEQGVEDALRRFATHPDEQMRQHFKHVPAYLRDLIHFTTKGYVDIPGCHIQLVAGLLADVPHHVLFIVINYDTLLERALTQYRHQEYRFTSLQNYLAPDRRAKVLKLHGSTNWFAEIGSNESGWEALVERLDITQRPHENNIFVAEGVIDVRAPYDKTREYLYPMITAPLAEKTLSDVVCPASHLGTVQRFLWACHKFLVIGTSGLDRDLFELLQSAIDAPKPLVHFVGKGEPLNGTIERFEKGVAAFRRRVLPGESNHDDGFRTYVSGQHFRSFLAAAPPT